MFKPKFKRFTLAVAAGLLFSAAATADVDANPVKACPADPEITVSAAGSEQIAGQPVAYTFSGCHNTVGDRYTVQALRVDRDATGALVETPVTQAQAMSRNGQAGSFSGSGEFVPAVDGRYLVRVLYFAVGQQQWEMKGEAIVRVAPAPAPVPPAPTPPAPAPPAPPAPTPTPEPEPQPEAEPTPVPVGDPAPSRARLTLTKTAMRKTVRAGRAATFKLTVRNVSGTVARDVKVCDRLPARTQYIRASVRVRFTGPNACTAARTLRPGQRFTFTLRLKVDRNMTGGRIVNRAVATAANANTVRDRATVRVPKSKAPRIKAPVTG